MFLQAFERRMVKCVGLTLLPPRTKLDELY